MCHFDLTTSAQRIETLKSIKAFCKKQLKTRKDRIIIKLVDKTEKEATGDHSPNYAKITWKQLKEIASDSLFTIGGHSLYHDILSELAPTKMREDIQLSIKLLEYNINEKIVHYSYPEGQGNHYNAEVINVLKEHAIVCCPSARMGLEGTSEDLFHLYRIMVGFMGTRFPYFDTRLQ